MNEIIEGKVFVEREENEREKEREREYLSKERVRTKKEGNRGIVGI